MQDLKQPQKIYIDLPKEDQNEQKYLFRVEEELVLDIVQKVLKAKQSIKNNNGTKNKIDTNTDAASITIQTFLYYIFNIIGVFLLLCVITFILMFKVNIITSMIGAFISLMFAFICFYIAHDIKKETDRSYIISLFSAIVAFCSLLASIANLFITYKK